MAKNNKEIASVAKVEKLFYLAKNIELGYLALAKELRNVRDNGTYAPVYESFDDLLEDLKISSGTASKMINIYETFVADYNVPENLLIEAGGWSVVAEILPVVTSKKSALEWLQKATVLTRSDLRKEIKESKTGIEMRHCDHLETFDFRICSTCKDKWRLYPTDDASTTP